MDMDKEGATLKKRDGSKVLDKRSTQVGGASLWTMDKEGATLKNVMGSKFLDKRSTQVGGASS